MKRLSLASQTVRTFIAAAALAVGAVGCGGGDGNNTGAAGSGGAGTGGAGTGGNCDAPALFANRMCSLNGACHDAQGSAAKFDMASAGWETHLVGVTPKGGGTIASMCATGANATRPYLEKGSNPATGLFLDKLKSIPPCGESMPMLTAPFNATELACIQSWATALTTK